MPRANTGDVERWLQDHDTDEVSEAPPIQNTWYEVFDAEDVRLLWCEIYQTNDEVAGKLTEVRWTIDGNVYFTVTTLADSTATYIYRDTPPSTGGTAGLSATATRHIASFETDKRGLSFKVEVRMTAALGTNQTLRCRCVRETQEIT